MRHKGRSVTSTVERETFPSGVWRVDSASVRMALGLRRSTYHEISEDTSDFVFSVRLWSNSGIQSLHLSLKHNQLCGKTILTFDGVEWRMPPDSQPDSSFFLFRRDFRIYNSFQSSSSGLLVHVVGYLAIRKLSSRLICKYKLSFTASCSLSS